MPDPTVPITQRLMAVNVQADTALFTVVAVQGPVEVGRAIWRVDPTGNVTNNGQAVGSSAALAQALSIFWSSVQGEVATLVQASPVTPGVVVTPVAGA